MGLRAVDHAAPSRNELSKSFSIDATILLTATFGVATFVFHFANAAKYGYQRDELYFISCAHHLALGYVDQPPLIALVARFVLTLFGDSLYAVRLLPALAAAFTVMLTGLFTRRLGGGLFASSLAMLGIALAPFYLAVGDLLTMNAFEPLFWLGTVYFIVRAQDEDGLTVWIGLGLTAGLGLIDKYSMFFFLCSCLTGLALTPAQRLLRRRGFYLAAAISFATVVPTLLWQAQNGWPQVELLRDAAAHKDVAHGPLLFFAQQFLMMNPLTAPLWLAGLYSLLFGTLAGRMRWYGVACVVLAAGYVALGAKVYYLAPIYPALLAAGGPVVEARLRRRGTLRYAYPAVVFCAGLIIAPEAFPLLPLNDFLRYQKILDVREIKMEKHPTGAVPQQFADQLGWDTLVRALAGAYERIPAAERRDAVILTRDYGQASAVDFFGPRYGLPPAISGHNNYYIWGPGNASGRVVLSVGVALRKLRKEFGSVRQIGRYDDPYVLPDFNDLPIYLCTHPRKPLALWWPAMKHYI